ncbi:MAG: UDP-3-O-(3-hydroxymyristoyl)glucosamine N-acyltransferase, partial [Campylobacteraceae bacterium]|nr:UDP-3-O-(3-hydroxymyristoyl)glucosamine N-acyltransferase [Campylobacteraceae bacterium]
MKLSAICKEFNLEFFFVFLEIVGFQTLDNATENHIVYLENEKLLDALSNTKAGAAIIMEKHKEYVPSGSSIIISQNPHLTMAILSKFFAPKIVGHSDKKPIISENATIMQNVYIGNGSIIKDNVILMHGVYIGENVEIEEGSLLHPNVVVYNDTKIGKNCIILANSTIGSDGFGYAHTKDGVHIKIYHTGNVILEDNVEIGANTTIDRAVFGSTIIKKGTKIDNLVQIGHNCEIGENTIIVSQVGLSGSTKTGRNVVMGGQSGTAGHLKIGDFATIASRGGVSKSIEGNKIYS